MSMWLDWVDEDGVEQRGLTHDVGDSKVGARDGRRFVPVSTALLEHMDGTHEEKCVAILEHLGLEPSLFMGRDGVLYDRCHDALVGIIWENGIWT